MSRDDANAVALWVLASYGFDTFFIFPRLLIKSPEKGCGKSTLIDLIDCLVNRPLVASHTTASPLFRLIEKVQPTILLDEADAYLGNNGEARAIINAGHKKGATVLRSVGDEHESRGFSVFAPMVIAGIGNQAETVEDRSIIIELKRKKAKERTERFRPDRADEAGLLARRCARWVADNVSGLSAADPVMPDALYNRAADNWRPLLAVADAIGGPWPEQSRAIAVSMAEGPADNVSLGVQLLRDIRDAFASKGSAPFGSNDLVSALWRMPDRPWNEYGRGKGLTANTLARLLEPFGIQPTQIRIGDRNIRGYRLEQFSDAFDRYLAPEAGYELPGTGPVIGNVTCMPLQNPDTCPIPPVQTATQL